MSSTLKRVLLTVAIAGSLLTCGLAISNHHAQNAATASNNVQTCSADCHNHGQNLSQAKPIQTEDDEVEPTPPAAVFQVNPNLLAYLLPVLCLYGWTLYRKQQLIYLWEQKLRF